MGHTDAMQCLLIVIEPLEDMLKVDVFKWHLLTPAWNSGKT